MFIIIHFTAYFVVRALHHLGQTFAAVPKKLFCGPIFYVLCGTIAQLRHFCVFSLFSSRNVIWLLQSTRMFTYFRWSVWFRAAGLGPTRPYRQSSASPVYLRMTVSDVVIICRNANTGVTVTHQLPLNFNQLSFKN